MAPAVEKDALRLPRGGLRAPTAAWRATITHPGLRATNQEVRNEDRRYRRHRPDRLEDRPHSAPGRPRGRRRLAQYRRQQHHRRGPQKGPCPHAGGGRPPPIALLLRQGGAGNLLEPPPPTSPG